MCTTGDPTKGFINGNTNTDDYLYDANGNMTIDKNKGITAITYNYLNLPQQVNKGATDNIVYTYDATGRKLSQQVFGNTPKTTDYIGELIYENNVLQFINTSEGRVLPDGTGWEYQYHLKDHLGNVRVTFTTKVQSCASVTASFESSTNPDFLNHNRIAFDLVDHTDAGTASTYVQKLYNSGRTGVARSMAVMPGDEVTISAFAKYMNLDNNSPNTAALITSFAAAFNVSPSSTGNEIKLYNGMNSYAGTVTSGNHDSWNTDDEGAPKAFVTILFFDKEYNFVDAAWDQISTAGAQTSPTVKSPHDMLTVTAVAKEAGYAYAFVSNEHPSAVEVFFDDVTVCHKPSPIVSSSDYFAFGLTFNSYSRENSVEQRFKFNSGSELISDLGLNWYGTAYRNYDPTIGRFWGIDKMAELFPSVTPMVFGYNNPVLFNDPLGLFGDDPDDPINCGTLPEAVVVTATRLNEDGTQDFSWLNSVPAGSRLGPCGIVELLPPISIP